MSDVQIHPYSMIFGWEDDEGLGAQLIEQIIRGEKTATCALKEDYTEEELRNTYVPVGKLITVYDKEGTPHCNVKLIEVFETTFGQPDPRLVYGEGNGTDIEQFQEDHRKAWSNLPFKLEEDSILIVELFEFVQS
ncbi:uncharacterized protein YhfF [Paenibacillus shirakamiensis]|uniref:Uncharacterized protein YhfF n=1 Tax=Paenibacillus shirakamiensis TaxID=1265935 RepID=A0ABS4JIX7_9BACL|nr:ASCH domain-containing protein [Paenibacillus shirakamiensis]MBP2000951.1 uncharacterized protein YhfF [Paenibacillus shirakamiensis]